MSGQQEEIDATGPHDRTREYQAPAIKRLGSLADLTLAKTVGRADGSTFLGLDIGS